MGQLIEWRPFGARSPFDHAAFNDMFRRYR
jgi:hypothetical protein